MTSLPSAFRRIRLELAREPGHPGGDSAYGYDFLAPLDAGGRIDAKLWKENRKACSVHRFRPGYDDDQLGQLVRGRSGKWFFDYEEGDHDDEQGFRFGEEQFVVGEYVSIREDDGKMHTFRVAAVERL
jgi:hypothetical protein